MSWCSRGHCACRRAEHLAIHSCVSIDSPSFPKDWMNTQYIDSQRKWRKVTREWSEKVGGDLLRSVTLRELPPAQAARDWLRPVKTDDLAQSN
jgi:hypothetical protein